MTEAQALGQCRGAGVTEVMKQSEVHFLKGFLSLLMNRLIGYNYV
ncbi:hypothetical protein V7111_11035 [Neobacillus niacini]